MVDGTLHHAMPRTVRASTWERFAHARIVHLVIVALLLVVVVSFGREVARRYAISRALGGLKDQVQDLQKQKSQLSDMIEYFRSPLFQEQEARTKLGLAKPGESVVIVPLAETDQAENVQQGTQQVNSNPLKWWLYFFGHS